MASCRSYIFVVGKVVLTLHLPMRPLSHNANPRNGAQDIWLVLQLGGRSTYSTYMQNGWSKFAMVDLLPGPCWPLLWARVTASAVMEDFRV